MRKVKFCGEEFEINFPSFLTKNMVEKFDKHFGRDQFSVQNCENFNDVNKVIDRYFQSIKRSSIALDVQVVFHKVKISKGKTDLSLKAEIECELSNSSFYVPKSMVITVANQHFLPAYFVSEKLSEVKSRSRYKSQQYARTPRVFPSFPDAFFDVMRADFLAKLPTQHDFEVWTKNKIEADKAKLAAAEIEKKQRDLEHQIESAARAKSIDDEKKRQEKRFAKLETKANVDIEYIDYQKNGNGFVKKILTAKNVTVKYSGSRAYLFFSGRENPVITVSKNVTIINEENEVSHESH